MTQPNAPPAAEREGEHHYVTCDVTDCPGYHCAHVAKELADATAALLAARDDARVVLTCRRCGFNAGNRAIFETHWRANHAVAKEETR